MNRAALNSALVAAVKGDRAPLARVMRDAPDLFDAETLGQVADILDGSVRWKPKRGKAVDHALVAARFWWLHLACGVSMAEAERWLAKADKLSGVLQTERTVEHIRKSETGAAIRRDTETKLRLYGEAELVDHLVEIGLASRAGR